MRSPRTGWGRRLADERGQTMVELALLLPVLTLLLMGIFDFSIAVSRSATLTAAVQEGVSYGRQKPSDTTNIKDHVKKQATGLNLADADITVTCYSGLTTTTISCSSAVINDSIKVGATYHYTPITGKLAALGGSTMNISQTAASEIY